MRVCIDARKINDSGIGTYIKNLLKEIAISDVSHEYFILEGVAGSTESFLGKLPQNFTPVHVRSKIFGFMEQIELPLLIIKNRIDIFHSTHYFLPFIKTCRYCVTICDLIPMIFPEQFSLLKRSYLMAMIRWAVINSDRIFSISEATKNDIVKLFGEKYEKKTDVILLAAENCVQNLLEAETSQDQFFKANNIVKGEYLLYVGLGKPHKNLERLVAAHEKLNIKNSIQLVLVGNIDKELPFLKNKANIIITGKVSDDQLAAIYFNAKIFVLVSLLEGFGLPILEAMASGVAVVTSNISSMPEVAGDAAEIVDPYSVDSIYNGILGLLKDENKRRRYIELGYERIKRFSWHDTAIQTIASYESVLKQ